MRGHVRGSIGLHFRSSRQNRFQQVRRDDEFVAIVIVQFVDGAHEEAAHIVDATITYQSLHFAGPGAVENPEAARDRLYCGCQYTRSRQSKPESDKCSP